MVRFCIVGFGAAGLVILLFQGLGRDPRELPPPPPPQRLEGLPAPVGPVVVTFWATWCGPCWADLALRPGADLPAGVTYLSVASYDTPDAAQKGVARTRAPPIPDPDGRLAVENGVTGFPTTLVVDATGRITCRIERPLDAESLRTCLRPAPEPPASRRVLPGAGVALALGAWLLARCTRERLPSPV